MSRDQVVGPARPREPGYTDGFLLLAGALLLSALAALLVPAVRRVAATREEPQVPLRYAEKALVPPGSPVRFRPGPPDAPLSRPDRPALDKG